MIRFVWKAMWGIFGLVLIGVGLSGQVEGGALNNILSVILGAGLVGWSYWKWQAKRIGGR